MVDVDVLVLASRICVLTLDRSLWLFLVFCDGDPPSISNLIQLLSRNHAPTRSAGALGMVQGVVVEVLVDHDCDVVCLLVIFLLC